MVKLPDGCTGPYPCRLTVEALATLQLRKVEPPNVTLEGLAVKESMVGSDVVAPTTTTAVDADTEFEPLVASSI
jgi:hypothetical protein